MNDILPKDSILAHAKIFVWAMILCLSVRGGADDTPPNTPIVTAIAGQPYSVHWPDGREAALKVSMTQSKRLRLGFKITENNCSDRQGMSCAYHVTFRRYWVNLVWTKNQDSGALGKTVQQVFKGNDGAPDSTQALQVDVLIAAGLDQSHLSGLRRGLPPHEIECDDYSWLPGKPNKVPEQISISRWDNEDTAQNPETGLNENRTVGGMYGVQLKHSSGQRLRIASVLGLLGSLKEFDVLMIESSQSLTLTKSDGSICQAAVSSEAFGGLTAEYERMAIQRPTSLDLLPNYIWGSDTLLTSQTAQQYMNYWFQAYPRAEYK